MNHLKQYIKLIRKAQQRNEGSESHHVFPRSIYGDNNYIVKLTLREHWVAHKLLFRACLKRYGNHRYTYKMANAVTIMGNRTSREYELARKYFVDNHHTKTQEGKRQISERMRGTNNPQWKKPAPNRGIPHTPESNQKNREAHNKTYQITYNTGECVIITGMKSFALQNNYNHSHLIQIGKGKRQRHKNIIGVKLIE